MTRNELDTTLKLMSEIYNGPYGDSLYTSGMVDGIRTLLDRLGYDYPELDYLDHPDSKIEKKRADREREVLWGLDPVV